MKKWVKSLFVALLAMGVLGACSELDEGSSEPTQAEEKKDDKKAEKPKETKKEEPKAEAADLGAGKFYVGEDIVPGRYIVSTEEEMGNFNIFPKKALDMGTVEILGTDESLAVNNITVDLKDGDEIEIGGLNKVHFEPK